MNNGTCQNWGSLVCGVTGLVTCLRLVLAALLPERCLGNMPYSGWIALSQSHAGHTCLLPIQPPLYSLINVMSSFCSAWGAPCKGGNNTGVDCPWVSSLFVPACSISWTHLLQMSLVFILVSSRGRKGSIIYWGGTDQKNWVFLICKYLEVIYKDVCDNNSWKGWHYSEVNEILWALNQLYTEEKSLVKKTSYWKHWCHPFDVVWCSRVCNKHHSTTKSHQNKNWIERSNITFE